MLEELKIELAKSLTAIIEADWGTIARNRSEQRDGHKRCSQANAYAYRFLYYISISS